MNAIERLKRDHVILRAKLDVLENALRMGPDTWYVLRELCFTLSRQLRDHIKREEELVVTCRNAMNPRVLAELAVKHKDEPKHLRAINRLFMRDTQHSLATIRPALTEVIDRLRHHMQEEEMELFPMLERVLADQEPERAVSAPSVVGLDETMTVNRVIQTFPKTRSVFEQLFINVPIEGCTCLDEVAWRHGMDCRQLLLLLEEAIAAEWNREGATVVSPQTAAA